MAALVFPASIPSEGRVACCMPKRRTLRRPTNGHVLVTRDELRVEEKKIETTGPTRSRRGLERWSRDQFLAGVISFSRESASASSSAVRIPVSRN